MSPLHLIRLGFRDEDIYKASLSIVLKWIEQRNLCFHLFCRGYNRLAMDPIGMQVDKHAKQNCRMFMMYYLLLLAPPL